MRIAVAQISTRPGDLQGNAARIAGFEARAWGKGADLVVFPMAALCGPTPVGGAAQESFMMDLTETLSGIADGCHTACLVPIIMDLDGETLPEVVLFQDGAITPLKFLAYTRALQDPALTGGASGMDDEAPAPDLPVIAIGGLKIGIAFTYDDLDDFEDQAFDLDVVIFISGYGYAFDDPSSVLGADLRENRFARDARALDAWIVGAGSLGGYGTQVYTGSSFVLDPDGRLAASAPAFEEDLLICDVAKKDDGGEAPAPASGAASPGALLPLEPEVYDRHFHLWQALALGLRDYLEGIGCQEAVVGLDGSLSSKVLLALATDALGPTRVHALICTPGDDAARMAAEALARNLRVDARRLPARAIAASVVNPEPGAELTALLARGVLEANLAAWADELGGVVLSSEDKSQLALARDINTPTSATLAPLGDVYRTDVLALARLRNTISPVFGEVDFGDADVVALPGVSRAGYSPETFQAAVDRVLAGYLEQGRSLNELIAAGGQDDALVQAVHDRFVSQEPARLGRTLYLMMSSQTLYDERVPLGLVWRDHPRAGEPGALSEDELDAMFDQIVDELADPRGHQDAGSGAGGGFAPSGRQDVRDMLGDINDFTFGGGFRPSGFGPAAGGAAGASGGAPGQGGGPSVRPDAPGDGWQMPFSEN